MKNWSKPKRGWWQILNIRVTRNPDCLTQVAESIDIWLWRRKGRGFMVS